MEGLCEFCGTEPKKYCCPTCGKYYCSVNCYKDERHETCSENFYKKSVFEELRGQKADKEDERRMMEMLKNLEYSKDDPLEPLDSDDEEELDLSERIKGVNLNDADALWEKLTDEERNEFHKLIDSGEINDILPTPEPWYIDGKTVPPIKPDIVLFNKISSKPPAESIKYNLLNILAAYSYMQRYFLGDYKSFPDECCGCLVSLSGSLKRNNDLRNVEMAIKTVFMEGLSNQFEVDTKMEAQMVKDVKTIVKKKDFILACLSDMLHLFKNLGKISKKTQGKFTKEFQDNFVPNSLDKQTQTAIKRRLEYFLSYTMSHFETELFNIIPIKLE
ncbi:zinc finger HIT domain-containing protein 2 [Culicoides brevitarsis]|uniref:zinc finger HIT domain-containing protein 2 n=1 Tax=Culicoides brevitarsis TaxID=469753 RepID=UPI00307BC814